MSDKPAPLSQAVFWLAAEKPELTIKYEHGPTISYFSYNQMRDAWLAGHAAATDAASSKDKEGS